MTELETTRQHLANEEAHRARLEARKRDLDRQHLRIAQELAMARTLCANMREKIRRLEAAETVNQGSV